jgi:hypothetical protein
MIRLDNFLFISNKYQSIKNNSIISFLHELLKFFLLNIQSKLHQSFIIFFKLKYESLLLNKKLRFLSQT